MHAIHPLFHLDARLVCINVLTESQRISSGHVAHEHVYLVAILDAVDSNDLMLQPGRDEVVSVRAHLLATVLSHRNIRLILASQKTKMDLLLGDRQLEFEQIGAGCDGIYF